MPLTTQFPVNEVFKETAEILTLGIYEDGDVATPSSPSYIIYDSGGTEKVSGIPSIASNVLSVSIADSLFENLEENCWIQWTFTVSGTVYKYNNIFDVVLNKLVNPVIDDDLKPYYPKITDKLWSSQDDYDDQIQQAFRDVKQDIKDRGNRPRLIVDAEQIKHLVCLRTFVIIFRAFSRKEDDIWCKRHLDAKEEYQTAFNKTQFKYDSNEDNVIDTELTMGNVRLKR